MNKKIPALIIAGIVFIFAGYNLWSYFDGKAEAEAEAARQAELQKIEADKQRQRQAEIAAEARREKQRLAEEKKQRIADEKEKKRKEEAERIAKIEAEKAAKKEAKRLAKEQREEQRRIEKLQNLRTPGVIEGISSRDKERMVSLSPRYITDNPNEMLEQKFDRKSFSSGRAKKLIQGNTNVLMLYSAISQDTDHLQALLDIGIDINDSNDKGYTAFHFASAYNTPEVIKFLADHKANIMAKSYHYDMNALHIASLLNPNPESIKMLVGLGLPLEEATQGVKPKSDNEGRKGLPSSNRISTPSRNTNGPKTPIIIATNNYNLEIVETLIDLGADTTGYDDKGQTLYYAVKRKRDIGNTREYKEELLKKLK